MRRYAEGTAVPVARSRMEIDRLLRQWGADGVQWTDDFKGGRAMLRFVWTHQGTALHARFAIQMPNEERLRKLAVGARGFSEARYAKLKDGAGREEHRVLLLWLKAAFNAVEAGIVEATTIFLPFLEGMDGRTVAEVAAPRIAGLLHFSADRFLSLPAGEPGSGT